MFWPGAERAGDLMTPAALVRAMVEVERAWLEALVAAGVAPADAGGQLGAFEIEDARGLVAKVASGSEAGGNPVIPLVRLLRQQFSGQPAAKWLHRGLTSQDVLDSALLGCLGRVLAQVRAELDGQIAAVARLADRHRATPMAGRTLTQHAVPTTFGMKAAQWLTALLDARDGLDRLPPLPVQFGGAAGNLSAVVELARLAGSPDPAATAVTILRTAAQTLDLQFRTPWHTARAPITAVGDALVGCCDAWGRIARDVIELGRPEIGELAEPVAEGRGGSSTMSQKRNPVLSVLIRRTALSAPQLAATLHLAAAEAVDERPDGSWHAEWPALQSLSRGAVVAAAQAGELLAGLEVSPSRMAENLQAAGEGIQAEQRSMAQLFPSPNQPETYLGLTDFVVDDVLNRARETRERR
nr:lyase family protein [Kineosporia rhizophila]